MPAMHDDVLAAMTRQLMELRDRVLTTVGFDMTHEECLSLIAPPEHHTILRDAAKVAQVNAAESWFMLHVPAEIDGHKNERAYILMRTHEETAPPLIPRDPQWHPNTPGGAKVVKWLTERYVIGRKFGLAQHVLYTLARICDNGATMRAMWPAVMFLCDYRPDQPRHTKWAEKHSAFKAVKHAPAISPHLKQAIRDTQTLLASATLIDADRESEPWGQVQIQELAMEPFDFHGQKIARL